MAGPPSKPKPAKPTHPARPLIILAIIGAILTYLIFRLREFLDKKCGFAGLFNGTWDFFQGEITGAELLRSTCNPIITWILFALLFLVFIASVLMVIGIFTTYRKLGAVNKKIWDPLKPPKEITYGVKDVAPERMVNPKWAKVLEHINSENPSDWKLAIIEADIMLNEALDKMGYHGTTLADKLKSIEPSDFDNLQIAWDAHKVRNAIAHEGSDFVMNKPEAERVVKMFQTVFQEFKYI